MGRLFTLGVFAIKTKQILRFLLLMTMLGLLFIRAVMLSLNCDQYELPFWSLS